MRLVLLILFTSLSAGTLHSQVYDSVSFAKVRVNGIALGSKKEELVKKFGEPHKTVTTESNRGVDVYSDYYYQKSALRINTAGIFNGFKLTDNNFVLQYRKYLIRAGDSMKEFAIYFPQSFHAYTKNASGKFKLRIMPGNTFIVFKTRDGVIGEIETKEEELY